ncbi:hypothetical protein [Ideonella sp.]|uniref:hypothetical protein n=1 Tax=Ideonella sp. TaxID=1929293 RepID=UPI0035B11308
MTTSRTSLPVSATAVALGALLLAGTAAAKLPPPSDEAKAKAAETAAKTAWTDKVAAYQLCKAQDKVAAGYLSHAKAAGRPASAPVETPPCADPGPFAYVPSAEAKPPLEASGAHSPARTATQPPSSNRPDAVVNPAPAGKPASKP